MDVKPFEKIVDRMGSEAERRPLLLNVFIVINGVSAVGHQKYMPYYCQLYHTAHCEYGINAGDDRLQGIRRR